MKILFVNVCVRKDSRTKRLADCLLATMEGEVTEVCLEQENLQPLSGALLDSREGVAEVKAEPKVSTGR